MYRIVQLTDDGSATIAMPSVNVTYHSTHGALQESMHVFIHAGLSYAHTITAPGDTLNVLEMGFGTGLNALLCAGFGMQAQRAVYYHGFETAPLNNAEVLQLNYGSLPQLTPYAAYFEWMHECAWGQPVAMSNTFTLFKSNISMLEAPLATAFYHVVFYDAFAPAIQPELWTAAVFERLYNCLKPGGVLVTYCSKGAVRRALQAAGFTVQKLAGPPGKREMLRAIKKVQAAEAAQNPLNES